jgi:cytochrome P450
LEESPIPLPVGNGYYAITRHADVSEISRKPELFCSSKGATSVLDLPEEMVEYFSGMINTDNPRHARLRRIVSNAFNPRMIKSIEDSIEGVANEVIDDICERGLIDVTVDLAAPLPLKIICDMMGVPPERYDDVFRCSNIILSMGDPEYIGEDTHPILAFLSAGAELTAIMEAIAEEKLQHPGDDLTSALITTNIDGEALTHGELASFFVLLVVAGNETTRTAITHGVLALTQHPDQKALWMADVEGHMGTAVDEIVRWASPVIWMRRTATTKVVVSGHEFNEGDKVLLYYSSANRDAQVFDRPFAFDLTRNPNPHLGFGAAGPHFCLGAHLARREIGVMFRELFKRLPDLQATGEPDRLQSNFVNGIKHLEATFTPTARR